MMSSLRSFLLGTLSLVVLSLCTLAVFAEVRVAAPSLGNSSSTGSGWQAWIDAFKQAQTSSFAFLLLPISAMPLTAALYWMMGSKAPAVAPEPTDASGAVKQVNPTHSRGTDTDIVIIGAGVGGASLGAALAARGFKVTIVEQSLEEPNRIVGELMQPSGCTLLRQMGLGSALEGFDAQTVRGYGLFLGNEMTRLEYPRSADGAILEGRSFHNGRFLMALRREVTKAGGELRQGKVSELTYDKSGRVNGVAYKTRDGVDGTVTAALTVVCDGLFSSFRSSVVSNVPQTRSKFLGLVLKDCVYPGDPLGGNVFLADPTPILLYPISSTEARMLIDFPADLPSDKETLKKFLLAHTIKQLPECMHPSFKQAVEDGASIAQMPNRQLCARPLPKPGCLTLGDALNVRHPLTGGGMTVALTDVSRIVGQFEGIKDMNQLGALDALVQHHYHTRSGPVAAINILADALYDVFGQKYASLRAACYDYLRQGGEQSAGPIRLLSGVSRSQLLLVGHFFAVAFWGIYRSCWPIPTPASVKQSYLMLRDANIIILPLLQQEHPGWMVAGVCCVLRTIFWIPYKSYVFQREAAL